VGRGFTKNRFMAPAACKKEDEWVSASLPRDGAKNLHAHSPSIFASQQTDDTRRTREWCSCPPECLKFRRSIFPAKTHERPVFEHFRTELQIPFPISLGGLGWGCNHAPSIVRNPVDRVRYSSSVQHLPQRRIRRRRATEHDCRPRVKRVPARFKSVRHPPYRVVRLEDAHLLAVPLREHSGGRQPAQPRTDDSDVDLILLPQGIRRLRCSDSAGAVAEAANRAPQLARWVV